MRERLLNELSGEELLLLALVKLSVELKNALNNNILCQKTYDKFDTIRQLKGDSQSSLSEKLRTQQIAKYLTGERVQDPKRIKSAIFEYLSMDSKDYKIFSADESDRLKEIKKRKARNGEAVTDKYPPNTREYHDEAIFTIAGLSEVEK